MELHFTSGHHPKGDGQTEQVNQVLEQYLRAYTNYQQDNWSTWLPLAEFAYNNAINETMGVSPFVANKGYHLTLAADPNTDVPSIRVQQFVTSVDELHQELKQNIEQSQKCYQKYADQRRSAAPHLKSVIMFL